jgi:hypothetical protein
MSFLGSWTGLLLYSTGLFPSSGHIRVRILAADSAHNRVRYQYATNTNKLKKPSRETAFIYMLVLFSPA